jgi:hypothetical protein
MLVATALYAALAFDLACTGTEAAGPLGLSVPDRAPTVFTITYRVDMDLRRWCSDACQGTEAIGDVLLGHILLRDESGPRGRHVIDFDPATGRLTDTLTDGDRQVLRHATCTRRAFSGFPSLQA